MVQRGSRKGPRHDGTETEGVQRQSGFRDGSERVQRGSGTRRDQNKEYPETEWVQRQSGTRRDREKEGPGQSQCFICFIA